MYTQLILKTLKLKIKMNKNNFYINICKIFLKYIFINIFILKILLTYYIIN